MIRKRRKKVLRVANFLFIEMFSRTAWLHLGVSQLELLPLKPKIKNKQTFIPILLPHEGKRFGRKCRAIDLLRKIEAEADPRPAAEADPDPEPEPGPEAGPEVDLDLGPEPEPEPDPDPDPDTEPESGPGVGAIVGVVGRGDDLSDYVINPLSVAPAAT